jgi:hypothetical protein
MSLSRPSWIVAPFEGFRTMMIGFKAEKAEPSRSSLVEPDRMLVRVIWGSALGSVYQRYPQSQPQRNRWLDANENGAESSKEAGSSQFSRSLDCPDCQGPLVPHQPSRHDPDRLIGTCQACEARFRLDVGEGGRIKSDRLSGPSASLVQIGSEVGSCH